jgi:hypothetical protein
MKSSWAISNIRCLYWTNVSRTISVIIIIIIIIIRDMTMIMMMIKRVASVQTPDVADSPRRLCVVFIVIVNSAVAAFKTKC